MAFDRRRRGRPVIGALSGFFFGLFVGLDLLFAGLVRLDNPTLTIGPVLGALCGFGLAWWAPIGRSAEPVAPTERKEPELVLVEVDETDLS